MTNKDIYISALVKLNEPITDGLNKDYDERVTYMLATFCHMVDENDAAYRKAYGIAKRSGTIASALKLDDNFPLCDVFIAPAISYVASELVHYDDENFSEDLKDEWICMMAEIEMGLPANVESIVNRYPL